MRAGGRYTPPLPALTGIRWCSFAAHMFVVSQAMIVSEVRFSERERQPSSRPPSAQATRSAHDLVSSAMDEAAAVIE